MNDAEECAKIVRNAKFTEDFLDLVEKYDIKYVEVYNVYTKQYVEVESLEIENEGLVIKYSTDFEE